MDEFPPQITIYDKEREEKLRFAKEKLRQFKEKKKEQVDSRDNVSITPSVTNPEASSLQSYFAQTETSSFLSSLPQQSFPTLQDQQNVALSSPINPMSEAKAEVPCKSVNDVENYQSPRTMMDQMNITDGSLAPTRVESETMSSVYQEKISVQAASIETLLSEKYELSSNLEKVQSQLKAKQDELQTLEQKLEETLQSKRSAEKDELIQSKNKEIETLRQECSSSKESVINQKHELSEFASKLKSKSSLAEEFEHKYYETKSRLEMVELNLNQMRSAVPNDIIKQKNEEISRLKTESEEQTKRLSDLSAYVQQSNGERDQIINQYTSYSQQLASQIEALNRTLNAKIEENSKLIESEKSLISHVEELEKRLQDLRRERDEDSKKVEREKKEEDSSEALSKLREEIENFKKEKEDLEAQIEEREILNQELQLAYEEQSTKLSSMETEIEMLRSSVESSHVDNNVNLVESMQSDKVAASRAMSQNVELKSQLEELQNALISLTNSKADLTNELDDHKRRAASLENYSVEIQGLRESLEEKERHCNALKDEVRHYSTLTDSSASSKFEPSNALSKELDRFKEEIRNLESHNAELRDQISVLSSQTREEISQQGASNTTATTPSSLSSDASYVHVDVPIDGDVVHIEKDDILSEEVESSTTLAPSEENFQNDVPVLHPDVATYKLQQKFHEAMMKIADLMGEKEHLEHIVVQLQEETETVGEYITLYQYQRSQQKKHLEEKEKQLQIVSRDREELMDKLEKLQSLISQFVDKNESNAPQVPKTVKNYESEASPSESVASKLTSDIPSFYVGSEESSTETRETANKILSLLNEIGTSTILREEFHPWFWGPTDGKLMTV